MSERVKVCRSLFRSTTPSRTSIKSLSADSLSLGQHSYFGTIRIPRVRDRKCIFRDALRSDLGSRSSGVLFASLRP